MKKACFTCEFITDALLGGAEPHHSAEIRVPSIRGQLRWWHRALGMPRAQEDRWFGSASGNSGRASAVILRVRSVTISSQGKTLEPGHQFLPAIGVEDIGCGDINSGGGYLAFNLRKPRRGSDPYKRGRIPEKTSFMLEVLSSRLPDEKFMEFCQLVRMFAKHGSIGTRSRRTFGCVRLVKEEGNIPEETTTLDNYSHRCVDWKELSINAKTVFEMREKAGQWLREKRRSLPKEKRNVVFGHAENGRLASPVVLRPFWNGSQLQLGLLIPRPLPELTKKAIE